MNFFQKHKNYLHLIIIGVLFLITCAYSSMIYLKWDAEVGLDEETAVEVNLPIIDWRTYTELSKQYENGIIE